MNTVTYDALKEIKMKTHMTFALVLGVACWAAECSAASPDHAPPSPWALLRNHINGIGGMEAIERQKSVHSEGEVEFLGGKMRGTFKEWIVKPDKVRVETEVNGMKSLIGSDGTVNWSLDQHGNLNVNKARGPVRNDIQRFIIKLLSLVDKPKNPFKLTDLGVRKLHGKPCRVVALSNRVDQNTLTMFFDADSSLLRLTEAKVNGKLRERRTYDDYRLVDGVKHPHLIKTVTYPGAILEKRTVTATQANPEIPPALFLPPEKKKTFTFSNGKDATDIDFELINGLIFIPCEMAGRRAHWILDSGANATFIHQKQVEKFGLKREGAGKSCVISQTMDVSFVKLPAFSFPGLEFNSHVVTAASTKGCLGAPRVEELGILGYDFISRFVIKIDYNRKKISFFSPENFVYSGSGSVVEGAVRERLLLVPATIDETASGDWILDTGASTCLVLRQFAIDHHLKSHSDRRSVTRNLNGTPSERKVANLKSLTIGDKKIENPQMLVSTRKEPEWLTRPVAGHIGYSILKNFVVYLDYVRTQIILE